MHQISWRGYNYGNNGNKQNVQGKRKVSYAIYKSAMFSVTDSLLVPPFIFQSVICL